MLDSILAVVLPIHIVAGAISALVAFPVAAFAVKGSRPHVAAGRCFVLGYVVVCLTGLLLEMERTTGGTIRVLWTEFKLVGPKVSDSGHLPPLLFFATATLDLAFLYLAVSGWRVWARARDATHDVFSRFDTILAATPRRSRSPSACPGGWWSTRSPRCRRRRREPSGPISSSRSRRRSSCSMQGWIFESASSAARREPGGSNTPERW